MRYFCSSRRSCFRELGQEGLFDKRYWQPLAGSSVLFAWHPKFITRSKITFLHSNLYCCFYFSLKTSVCPGEMGLRTMNVKPNQWLPRRD